MGKLGNEEMEKLIRLCRIECSEEEKQVLQERLLKILNYMEELNAVDTSGIEPCSQVTSFHDNVTREDVVGELLPRELFLANAPAHIGGMIRVPPVIKF